MLFLQMDVPFGYGLFALAAVTVSVGSVSYTHLTLPTNREV